MQVAVAHRDEQAIDGAFAKILLRAVHAQPQLDVAGQQAHQHQGQGGVIERNVPEKVLNPRFVRGRLYRVIEVMRNFTKLNFSAFRADCTSVYVFERS